MSIVSTFLYFILALGILITVHEYGHFLVARLVGVKVLRFSIGFGKSLFSWQGKSGTEYVLAAFPLGGYVKMIDEDEGPVKEEDKPYAFTAKSVWARMAIVVAGPLFNLIFAVLALWLMYFIGLNTLAPIVGEVVPHSVAAQAKLAPRDEILSLNQTAIPNWRQFQIEMMTLLGDTQAIPITIKKAKTGTIHNTHIVLKNWQINHKRPDILKSLGITPFIPDFEPVVGEVIKGMPAEKAGMRKGDKILSINGEKITYWGEVVVATKVVSKEPLRLEVLNKGKIRTVFVLPEVQEVDGQKRGMIGLKIKSTWPEDWLRIQRYSLFPAFKKAFVQTGYLTVTTLKMIGKLVTGKVSLRNISGPIGVAEGAGQSANGGVAYYLAFLALISVSLGVLNLLPIPMLDGGHLLYCFAELLLGRPLSKRLREKGMMVGIYLLLCLMAIAVFNDVTRLIG